MAVRAGSFRSVVVMAAAIVAAGCGDTSTSPSNATPAAAWSAPRLVAAMPESALPTPRMAGLGDAVRVVWESGGEERIESAWLGADGAWRGPETIGPASVSEPLVGVDAAGRAVAAWAGPDPESGSAPRRCVWAATTDAAGHWGDAVALACEVSFVRLAVGPAGHAAVVWSSVFDPDQPTGSSRYSLWSARYHPDTGWSDLRALTFGLRAAELLSQMAVAVDENGLAAVAWYELPELNDSGRIHLATGHAGEPWSTSILFGPAPGLRDPRVAFESPGVPVLAWRGVGGGVQSMRVTAGTNFANTITSNLDDTCIRIAGSGRGESLVTWWRLHNPGVWVESLSGGGPENLRVLPPQNVASCPVVAMDEAGNAVVAWEENASGRSGEVWASVRRGPRGQWTRAVRLDDEGARPTAAIAKGVAYVVWRSGSYQGPSGLSLMESRLPLTIP